MKITICCTACTRAAINPLTAYYASLCFPCQARALAHSPIYSTAVRQQRMTADYIDLLNVAFGPDWGPGHKKVKEWAERIKAAQQHREQV